MGLFDFVKNAGSKIFGRNPRDDDDDEVEITKPLRQHLKDNKIDPANIRTRFQNSVLVVEGWVPDQDTREKAILVLGNVEGVGKVDDRLQVGRPVAGAAGPSFGNVQSGSSSTAGAPQGSGSQNVGHASAGGSGGAWTSTTYTVKKGDTLSAIAKETLGSANRYTEIFEANKPMLKDPDKIYPGQVLRIPKK